MNRQSGIRVPLRPMEIFLRRARQALRLPAGSLTVALVTRAEIAKWNRDYRHKHGPTDVLSFPAEAQEPRKRISRRSRRKTRRSSAPNVSSSVSPGESYLGDVAIAPAVARENARRFGRTFDQELKILILHGMLHLMGYDHETDTGQMDRRERRLRRKLGIS